MTTVGSQEAEGAILSAGLSPRWRRVLTVLFFVLLAAVTYMTVTPRSAVTDDGLRIADRIAAALLGDPTLGDKLAHFSAYAALGFTAALAGPARRRLWAVVLLALYGALLEGVQRLGGVRTMDVWDGVANAAGAGVGTAAALAALFLAGAASGRRR
ncbi:MAG: VanZ family protein [Pseudomonadota bacterium]